MGGGRRGRGGTREGCVECGGRLERSERLIGAKEEDGGGEGGGEGGVCVA